MRILKNILIYALPALMLCNAGKDNKLHYPHQTSWGVSTRMIGALIMVHSDDDGLVPVSYTHLTVPKPIDFAKSDNIFTTLLSALHGTIM